MLTKYSNLALLTETIFLIQAKVRLLVDVVKSQSVQYHCQQSYHQRQYPTLRAQPQPLYRRQYNKQQKSGQYRRQESLRRQL